MHRRKWGALLTCEALSLGCTSHASAGAPTLSRMERGCEVNFHICAAFPLGYARHMRAGAPQHFYTQAAIWGSPRLRGTSSGLRIP
eukprot:1159447-Pelagomonas_calceolata.AAC.6